MSVLTLSNLKAYLRIAGNGSDTDLQMLLDACEEWIAKYLSIKLASSASIVEYVEPDREMLFLTSCPVTAVTSVVDQVDDSTVDASKYTMTDRGVRKKARYEVWDPGSIYQRYKVTYTGGYSSVPKALELVIYRLVGQLHRTRSGEQNAKTTKGFAVEWAELIPPDIKAILNAYDFGRSF